MMHQRQGSARAFQVAAGDTLASFPLEGGTLSLAPPQDPQGGGGDVLSYLAPVSWMARPGTTEERL